MSKIENAINKSTNSLEVRRFSATECRMSPDGQTLRGYAAKYDSGSFDMGYIETIAPGAFDRTLADDDEVLALVEHDTGKLLGRRSAGTLRLDQDTDGLTFEIDLPQTQLGNDTREQITRGDLGAMSFAFSMDQDTDEEWSTADGKRSRRLLNLRLHDISVVASPAYPKTELTVKTRSSKMKPEVNKMDEVRRLTAEMRSILDGNMDAQATENYDQMEQRLGALETEIRGARRADSLARAEALLDEPTRTMPKPMGNASSAEVGRESRAYSEAFFAMLSGSANTEQRDMLAGSGTGVNIVPSEMESSILELLDVPGSMRAICSVTQARGNREIPIESAIGTGAWVGEQGPLTTSNVTLAQKTATPKSFGTGIAWSSLMSAQAIVNVDAYFGRAVGRVMADGLEAGYVNGTGTGTEPEGLVTSLGTPVAMDLPTNKGDGIIDAVHSLASQYRTGARWLMPDSVLATIRKLKATDGTYLFKPSERYSDIRDGVPGMLYGYPINIVDAIPATQCVFGNIERCYRIFDWGKTAMLIDPYTNASTMTKTLWAYRATDGVNVDAASAGLFKTTA